jgi:hypothetical protein
MNSILIRVGLICVCWLTSLQSHASDLQALQLRVNEWITNNLTAITSSQTTYRAANPHYFQGRITHSTIPSHTTANDSDAPADRLTDHPTDQPESWMDVMPFLDGQNMPAALRIDIYKGQQGQGWVLKVFIKHDGVLYVRIKSTGLEAAERDSDWAIDDP